MTVKKNVWLVCFLSFFLLFSCDPRRIADITVINNAGSDVTDIWLLCGSGKRRFSLLEAGDRITITDEWRGGYANNSIVYYIDDVMFDIEQERGVKYDDVGVPYSEKRVKNNSKAVIIIYDDGYEIKVN
ncbi:hypothetical protein [Treponema endosymbiont of Eucomonympha sp.]|uniref:hypothetical protein n=1 Tax=Treponema endosymbiont of Eucomonympha sp. TaxID=1580831 RepID=UPI000781A0F5|nr:hypothetical protein [Treponema endosymbiont of Eucomonympha sp.]